MAFGVVTARARTFLSPKRFKAGDPVADRMTRGPVEEAVSGDLSAFGGGLERSGLAAAALSLARELDDRSNSATSKSMCAKALLDVMDRLRELAPPKVVEEDRVADLNARRAARLAGQSGA